VQTWLNTRGEAVPETGAYASKIQWYSRVQWLNGLSRTRTQRRANVAVVKEAALQLCHPDRVPVGDRASAVSHFLDHFFLGHFFWPCSFVADLILPVGGSFFMHNGWQSKFGAETSTRVGPSWPGAARRLPSYHDLHGHWKVLLESLCLKPPRFSASFYLEEREKLRLASVILRTMKPRF
jgi:hypothetical protein